MLNGSQCLHHVVLGVFFVVVFPCVQCVLSFVFFSLFNLLHLSCVSAVSSSARGSRTAASQAEGKRGTIKRRLSTKFVSLYLCSV